MDNSLRTLVSRKYGFWFYQLVGWGVFIVYDFFINVLPDEKFNLKFVIFWIIIILFPFTLTLLLRLIYRRIYDGISRIFFQIIAIAIASIICGILWQFFQNLVTLIDYFKLPSMFNNTLNRSAYRIIISYFKLSWPIFVWSILYYLIKSRLEYQEEKENAVQSHLMAKDAQLRALRYQINPHFLFNTLISVQGLMYHNTKLADTMLTELSDFLRYSLRYNQLVFVPLEDEIEIINKYLTIQKIRFGEKLKYSFSVANDTKKIQILCFLLQPLVENAIMHGMKTSKNGLQIRIRTELTDSILKLEIINTGKYNPKNNRVGTGLNNVNERLENAYPDQHEFGIIQVDDEVHVTIKINTVK